jgi:Uncharacterized protein conserved in bacteria (DUF2237)
VNSSGLTCNSRLWFGKGAANASASLAPNRPSVPDAANDLSTPMPEFGFRGLKPGDRWCLCALRWQEALEAGQAPRVVLRATHEGALGHCTLADLKRLAVDLA